MRRKKKKKKKKKTVSDTHDTGVCSSWFCTALPVRKAAARLVGGGGGVYNLCAASTARLAQTLGTVVLDPTPLVAAQGRRRTAVLGACLHQSPC